MRLKNRIALMGLFAIGCVCNAIGTICLKCWTWANDQGERILGVKWTETPR